MLHSSHGSPGSHTVFEAWSRLRLSRTLEPSRRTEWRSVRRLFPNRRPLQMAFCSAVDQQRFGSAFCWAGACSENGNTHKRFHLPAGVASVWASARGSRWFRLVPDASALHPSVQTRYSRQRRREWFLADQRSTPGRPLTLWGLRIWSRSVPTLRVETRKKSPQCSIGRPTHFPGL